MLVYQRVGLWGNVYKVGPPNDSVQLVQITPIIMVKMVPITIVFMGFINHLITGGPHLVDLGLWGNFNDASIRDNNGYIYI